jgi:hypothetical protein
MSIKQFQIEFNGKSSEHLEEISQQLNLSRDEIIRKGLKFIALYAKSQAEKDTRLILEKKWRSKRDNHLKEVLWYGCESNKKP